MGLYLSSLQGFDSQGFHLSSGFLLSKAGGTVIRLELELPDGREGGLWPIEYLGILIGYVGIGNLVGKRNLM